MNLRNHLLLPLIVLGFAHSSFGQTTTDAEIAYPQFSDNFIEIRLTNTGNITWQDWTVSFELLDQNDQLVTISGLFGAVVTTGESDRINLRHESYNATVAPGGTANFGFAPGGTGIQEPTNFVINGLPITPDFPKVSIANAEADEAAVNLTFTVTLDGTYPEASSLTATTSNGEAEAGSDYTAKTETLTFAAGESTKTFSVAISDDNLAETNETFTVTLSNPNNLFIEQATGIGTIIDNETPQPTSFRLWLESSGVPMTSDPCSDADGDGECLLLEYAFNNKATLPDSVTLSPRREGNDLVIDIPEYRDDVKYEILVSKDLTEWDLLTDQLNVVRSGTSATVTLPLDSEETYFVQVRVSFLEYVSRFLEIYHEIHDPANGYFSPLGIPYHSIETLLCEAPDYGHETTSEAFSYYLWLEAMYGKFTGDWAPLAEAWRIVETYLIPTEADQPTNDAYSAASPAGYTNEMPLPDMYPVPIDSSAAVGTDPLGPELEQTYGDSNIYIMHWLLDVDNWYGYGRRGDGVTAPSYINTFQRGEQESVWETVPHPSWESFNFGTNDSGFLSLFIDDPNYAQQWRYTAAPDADARAVQAMYWAKKWADEQGGSAIVDGLMSKTRKMGDYLRYSFYDKYFREIGEFDNAGTGKNSAHYLLSWYFSWGGSVSTTSSWAFRIGSSHCHAGYQNPMAAWVLSSNDDFTPTSPTAKEDWTESFKRQMEFYLWLQSTEGGVAGGATNSIDGQYNAAPAGVTTFYGMPYDEDPVYHDPPSNSWFGFQAWTVERIAELYHEANDPQAKRFLDKWVPWVVNNVILEDDGTYGIPVSLEWSGQPEVSYSGTGPIGDNPNLSVTVTGHNQDVGILGSLCRALLYYSSGTKKHTGTQHLPSYETAKELLDRQWSQHRTAQGLGVAEKRADYVRFFEQEVFVPTGFSGTNGQGATVEPGVSFLDLRPKYRDDPKFAELEAAYQDYLQRKATDPDVEFVSPDFTYHRFFGQIDAALANAEVHLLFGE